MNRLPILLGFIIGVLAGTIIYPNVIFASHRDTTIPTPQQRISRRISPTPKIKSTSTLKPTKRPSATPTKRPSPTPTKKISTPTPTKQQTNNSSLSTEQLFIHTAINDFRKSKGLSEVKTDTNTCNFAALRAKEITTSFNHDGFRQRIDSTSLPYPSYHMVTENIAMTSNYQDVVNMWINSEGHRLNMEKDTPFVCVGKEGKYYAYEGWKP